MKTTDINQVWPQFLVTGAATICYFSTCINTGWSTPFLPKILSGDYPFEVTSEEASYITIVSPLGIIFGGFMGGFLIEKWGPKNTVLAISVPQIVSFSMIALSYNAKELLYIARFSGGLSEGVTFSMLPIYIAEIAQPDVRGTLGMAMGVFGLVSVLFVNILGTFVSIRSSALIFLMFPILFIVTFWKMPESPYYLLMKGRKNEAKDSLRFLRGNKNVDSELSNLVDDVKRQTTDSGGYKDLFLIRSNRKALLIAIGARTVQQFTGCSAFNQYMQLLLKEATKSIQPFISSSIVLSFQILVLILSGVFIDRFGRKPLLLISTGGCFLDLALSSIYFFLREHTSVDVSQFDWFPLVMMVVLNILYSLGLGMIVAIVVSEMFAANIKSKAACLTNVFYGLGMIVAIKYYQVTADSFGLMVPYLSFAFCTFLGVLFIYFLLPETKGKTLGEIQQQLKGIIE